MPFRSHRRQLLGPRPRRVFAMLATLAVSAPAWCAGPPDTAALAQDVAAQVTLHAALHELERSQRAAAALSVSPSPVAAPCREPGTATRGPGRAVHSSAGDSRPAPSSCVASTGDATGRRGGERGAVSYSSGGTRRVD